MIKVTWDVSDVARKEFYFNVDENDLLFDPDLEGTIEDLIYEEFKHNIWSYCTNMNEIIEAVELAEQKFKDHSNKIDEYYNDNEDEEISG